MDEIVDFIASNIIIVGIIGAIILVLKFIVVYLLISTKKPHIAFTKKSIKSIFNKNYTAEDIKKSKSPFRVFLKKANNSFKIITYSWLILLVVSIFFRVAAFRNNGDAPVENTQQSPTSTEE